MLLQQTYERRSDSDPAVLPPILGTDYYYVVLDFWISAKTQLLC